MSALLALSAISVLHKQIKAMEDPEPIELSKTNHERWVTAIYFEGLPCNPELIRRTKGVHLADSLPGSGSR